MDDANRGSVVQRLTQDKEDAISGASPCAAVEHPPDVLLGKPIFLRKRPGRGELCGFGDFGYETPDLGPRDVIPCRLRETLFRRPMSSRALSVKRMT